MNFSKALKFACAAGLLIAAAAAPAQARTSFTATGGTGDHANPIECGNGEFLVGFAGRAGSWIDQVRPICATVSSDGRVGTINDNIQTAGGNGGGPVETDCPADSFINSITPKVRHANNVVGRIDFTCYRPLDGQYLPDIKAFGGPDAYNEGRQECPDGEIGTGVNVRYGKHVNAISLICDVLVIPAKAASAKPAKPASSGAITMTSLSFAGEWKTTTSQNGHFTVVLNPVLVNTPMPGEMIQFTGTMVNTDGAHQYDGQIQGTAQYPTLVMNFTYVQPQVNAAGTGAFTLSSNGKTFTGSGFHMQDEPFAWNGARNMAPPAPAAPAGAATSDEEIPVGHGGKNTDGDGDIPVGHGGKNIPQAVSPMEQGIDRPGNDYSQTVKDDPETCQAECLADGKCVAWTWVQPGVQGPNAQCYLKDRVPPARPGDCCTSGVK